MKKTLSLFLSVLMMLSVFTVAAFAVEAPELKNLECTYDGVALTWDASDDAINYLVYRAEGDGDLICIATTTDTEYVDVSAVENKTYVYTVAVQGSDGSVTKPNLADGELVVFVKPYCAHKEFKWVLDYRATVYASGKRHKECKVCHKNIGDEIIPQLKPATPTVKSVAVKPTNIVVTWNAVDGATSYTVYRRVVGGSWVNLGAVTTTKFTDKKVVSGKSYQYTVRARNAAGLSAYKASAAVKFFTAPTNIAAANAANSVKVTWTAVKGATVYRVYRKLAGDDAWTYIGNTKTTSYIDKNVVAADTYSYTVKAGDGKNYSSYDKVGASLTRLDAPKLTKAVSSKEGITVTINHVDGAKGYDIYRKTGNSGWVKIARVNSARSNGYLDKSTKKGVTYTYTIRAFNGTSRSYYDTKGITVKDVH